MRFLIVVWYVSAVLVVCIKVMSVGGTTRAMVCVYTKENYANNGSSRGVGEVQGGAFRLLFRVVRACLAADTGRRRLRKRFTVVTKSGTELATYYTYVRKTPAPKSCVFVHEHVCPAVYLVYMKISRNKQSCGVEKSLTIHL